LHIDLLERVPKCFLLLAGLYLALQLVGVSIMSEYKVEESDEEERSALLNSNDDSDMSVNVKLREQQEQLNEINSLGVK
jgi:hypothetical protein